MGILKTSRGIYCVVVAGGRSVRQCDPARVLPSASATTRVCRSRGLKRLQTWSQSLYVVICNLFLATPPSGPNRLQEVTLVMRKIDRLASVRSGGQGRHPHGHQAEGTAKPQQLPLALGRLEAALVQRGHKAAAHSDSACGREKRLKQYRMGSRRGGGAGRYVAACLGHAYSHIASPGERVDRMRPPSMGSGETHAVRCAMPDRLEMWGPAALAVRALA